MEYIATYHTDVGTRKETNQDSLAIKVVNTKEGNVAFAIVCDGMGGLAKGEVASKEVIEAFCTWFDDTLWMKSKMEHSQSRILYHSGMILSRFRIAGWAHMERKIICSLVRRYLQSCCTRISIILCMWATAACMSLQRQRSS